MDLSFSAIFFICLKYSSNFMSPAKVTAASLIISLLCFSSLPIFSEVSAILRSAAVRRVSFITIKLESSSMPSTSSLTISTGKAPRTLTASALTTDKLSLRAALNISRAILAGVTFFSTGWSSMSTPETRAVETPITVAESVWTSSKKRLNFAIPDTASLFTSKSSSSTAPPSRFIAVTGGSVE